MVFYFRYKGRLNWQVTRIYWRSVELSDLIFNSDQSLAVPAYSSNTQNFLNVAGIGFTAWQNDSIKPQKPFSYHSTELPV